MADTDPDGLDGYEWDSEMSNAYQDGREQGEADELAGLPYDETPMSRERREGYDDGREEVRESRVKSAATRRGA